MQGKIHFWGVSRLVRLWGLMAFGRIFRGRQDVLLRFPKQHPLTNAILTSHESTRKMRWCWGARAYVSWSSLQGRLESSKNLWSAVVGLWCVGFRRWDCGSLILYFGRRIFYKQRLERNKRDSLKHQHEVSINARVMWLEDCKGTFSNFGTSPISSSSQCGSFLGPALRSGISLSSIAASRVLHEIVWKAFALGLTLILTARYLGIWTFGTLQ